MNFGEAQADDRFQITSIPSCNPILGQLPNLISRHVSFPSGFEFVLHGALTETLPCGFNYEWMVGDPETNACLFVGEKSPLHQKCRPSRSGFPTFRLAQKFEDRPQRPLRFARTRCENRLNSVEAGEMRVQCPLFSRSKRKFRMIALSPRL